MALQLGLINYVFPADGFSNHARGWCSQVVKDRAAVLPIVKQAVARCQCKPDHEKAESAALPFEHPSARNRGCNC